MSREYLTRAVIVLFLIIFLTGLSHAGAKYTLVYVVQEGDTLSEISEDYGISVTEIRQANNLSKDYVIKLGQDLVIPEKKKDPDPDFNQLLFQDGNKKNDNEDAVSYTFNNDSNYQIRINPGNALPIIDIPSSKIITYHVGYGDTLYDLAKSFNTSVGIIMALNNMDKSVIKVGQKLSLPINKLTPRQVLARTISRRDLELLARAIHGEARGEPFIGQVAVGAVVINRVLSSYFPDDFAKVIYQKRQFSAVADGQFQLAPSRTAYRAAREALKGTDPTMGSLYYYNPRTAKHQWWFKKRRTMVTIGDHVFTK